MHAYQEMTWAKSAAYAVPALIYAFVNNASVVAYLYLSAMEVMVLGQLRVLFTALLAWRYLRTPIAPVQWAALLVLSTGVVISQLDCDGGVAAQPAEVSFHLADKLVGYVLIVLVCLGSAAAGTYNEVLLKNKTKSIHVANVLLYSYGLGVCLATHVVASTHAAGPAPGPAGLAALGALNAFGVLYVLNQAVCGLIVSALLRYGSAILKLFSAALSMVLLAALSWLCGLDNPLLNPTFVLGSINVYTALMIYILAKKPDDPAASRPTK